MIDWVIYGTKRDTWARPEYQEVLRTEAELSAAIVAGLASEGQPAKAGDPFRGKDVKYYYD